jgi:23S rRNA (cytosine1962-C5)-methyltransferase
MTASWIEPSLLRSFAQEHTDAHRLYTAPDGWVERYGNDVLVSYQTAAACERIATEIHLWAEKAEFRFSRLLGRDLPKRNEERDPPRLLSGDESLSLQSVVTERYLQYGIDFSAGYSAGLFLDQRNNRGYVRDLGPPTLLNCFAYTCSFSVAGAANGARTTNIDLSKKSLARGRENFALNSLATDEHHFIADDVMEVLPRLARRGEKFAAIILDPPTFSRARRGGGEFQVERDFEQLLMLALEVAERDAHILLSTNYSAMSYRTLEVMARFCLKTTRRAGTLVPTRPLPDFPPGAGATTAWLALR